MESRTCDAQLHTVRDIADVPLQEVPKVEDDGSKRGAQQRARVVYSRQVDFVCLGIDNANKVLE